MIASFRSCEFYMNYCISQILQIVITNPQFNNEKDVSELFDIYMRKFILANRGGSYIIRSCCQEFVDFWFYRNRPYYFYVFGTFESSDDAYHYLAVLAQFHRMVNLYGLRSADRCNYLVIANVVRFCMSVKY